MQYYLAYAAASLGLDALTEVRRPRLQPSNAYPIIAAAPLKVGCPGLHAPSVTTPGLEKLSNGFYRHQY